MKLIIYNESICFQNRIIVIIGNGFIGSALSEKLFKIDNAIIHDLKIDWLNYEKIQSRIIEALELIDKTKHVQVDWIWSAGKTGFSSTKEENDKELRIFSSIITVIKNNNVKNLFNFHLISSAGGLFEGQINITKNSIPTPKRPYGELKLIQENLVAQFFPDKHTIYRLSSVYGNSNKNQRIGLITALIRNAMTCKSTTIQGSFDTKRDFVCVNDIANFIVDKIALNIKEDDALFYLVSGKPTTIFEIISIIKKITNSKVMYTLNFSLQNNEQIVFSPNLLHPDWSSTSIETSIRNLYHQILITNSTNF